MLQDYLNKKIAELTSKLEELEKQLSQAKKSSSLSKEFKTLEKSTQKSIQAIEHQIKEVLKIAQDAFVQSSKAQDPDLKKKIEDLSEQTKRDHMRFLSAIKGTTDRIERDLHKLKKDKPEDVAAFQEESRKKIAELEASVRKYESSLQSQSSPMFLPAALKLKVDQLEKQFSDLKQGTQDYSLSMAVQKSEDRLKELEDALRGLRNQSVQAQGILHSSFEERLRKIESRLEGSKPSAVAKESEQKHAAEKLEAFERKLKHLETRSRDLSDSIEQGSLESTELFHKILDDFQKKTQHAADKVSKDYQRDRKNLEKRLEQLEVKAPEAAGTEDRLVEVEIRLRKLREQVSTGVDQVREGVEKRLIDIEEKLKGQNDEQKRYAEGVLAGDAAMRLSQIEKGFKQLQQEVDLKAQGIHQDLEVSLGTLSNQLKGLAERSEELEKTVEEKIEIQIQSLGIKVPDPKAALVQVTDKGSESLSPETEAHMEALSQKVEEKSLKVIRENFDAVEVQIRELENGFDEFYEKNAKNWGEANQDFNQRIGGVESQVADLRNEIQEKIQNKLEDVLHQVQSADLSSSEALDKTKEALRIDLTEFKKQIEGLKSEEAKLQELLHQAMSEQFVEFEHTLQRFQGEMAVKVDEDYQGLSREVEGFLDEMKSLRKETRQTHVAVDEKLHFQIQKVTSEIRNFQEQSKQSIAQIAEQARRDSTETVQHVEGIEHKIDSIHHEMEIVFQAKIEEIAHRLDDAEAGASGMVQAARQEMNADLEGFKAFIGQLERDKQKHETQIRQDALARFVDFEARLQEMQTQAQAATSKAQEELTKDLRELAVKFQSSADLSGRKEREFDQKIEAHMDYFNARIMQLQESSHDGIADMAEQSRKSSLELIHQISNLERQWDSQFQGLEQKLSEMHSQMDVAMTEARTHWEDRLLNAEATALHLIQNIQKSADVDSEQVRKSLAETIGQIQKVAQDSQARTDHIETLYGTRIQTLEASLELIRSQSQDHLLEISDQLRERGQALTSQMIQLRQKTEQHSKDTESRFESVRFELEERIVQTQSAIRQSDQMFQAEMLFNTSLYQQQLDRLESQMGKKIKDESALLKWDASQLSEQLKEKLSLYSDYWAKQIDTLQKSYESMSRKEKENQESAKAWIQSKVEAFEGELKESSSNVQNSVKDLKQGMQLRSYEMQLSIDSVRKQSGQIRKQVQSKLEVFGEQVEGALEHQATATATLEGDVQKQAVHFEERIHEVSNHVDYLDGELKTITTEIQEDLRNQWESADENLLHLQEASLEHLDDEIDALEEKIQGIDLKTNQMHDSLKFQFESQLEDLANRTQSTQAHLKAVWESRFGKLQTHAEALEKKIDLVGYRSRDRHRVLRERLEDAQDSLGSHIQQIEKTFSGKIENIHQDLEIRFKQAQGQMLLMDAAFLKLGNQLKSDFEVKWGEARTRVEDVRHRLDDITGRMSREMQEQFNLLASQIETCRRDTATVEKNLYRDFQRYQESVESRFEGHKNQYRHMMDTFSSDMNRQVEGVSRRFENVQTHWGREHEKSSNRIEYLHSEVKDVRKSLHQGIWERLLEEEMWKSVSERVGRALGKLTGQSEEIHAAVDQKYWGRLKRKSLLWLLAIVLLVAMSLYAVYVMTLDQTQQTVKQDLQDRFSDSQVRETLVEAAKSEVPGVLRSEAEPVINQLQSEMQAKAGSFEGFLGETRERYEAVYQTFRSEVTTLKQVNEVSRLENEAMNDGNPNAYAVLREIALLTNFPDGAEAAKAAIKRIEAFYKNGTSLRAFSIYYEGPTGVRYQDNTVPFEVLISYLRDEEDWHYRAKAAKILGTWNRYGVPDYLMLAATEDAHLQVVSAAMQSFAQITRFPIDNVLDVASAKYWWERHREEINAQLPG